MQKKKNKILNWWRSALISILPLAVSSYMSIWKSDKLELVWQIIFTILIILSMGFTVAKYYYEKIDDEKKENAEKYYQIITERYTGLTEKMTEEVIKDIGNAKYANLVAKPLKPFYNRTSLDPYHKIENYCNEVKEILASHFDTDSTDVGLSVYVLDKRKNGKWRYLHQSMVAQIDLSPKEIAQNRFSTFFHVKDVPGLLIFDSKKTLYDQHKYIPTESEKTRSINGSMFCKNISLVAESGDVILPLVFCVTTYGKKICSEKDIFAKEKAQKLLEKVSDEIKYEIANLALYRHIGLRNRI